MDAMEPLYALDHEPRGTGALDLPAHGVDAVGEVDHLGLLRGIVQHGGALGQRRGHHEVLRPRNRRGLQADMGPAKPPRPALDVALGHLDLGAEGTQAVDVEVNRPRADGAASRKRHLGPAEAGQQRPEHQDGGPHGLDQLVGGAKGLDGGRVDLHLHALVHGKLDPHPPEELHGGGDIVEVRDIADGHRVIGEQRRGHHG